MSIPSTPTLNNPSFPNYIFGGVTGIGGPFIPEDAWDYPEKIEKKNDIAYHVQGEYHCAFGPALHYKDGSVNEWYIKGIRLTKDQIETAKSILADIKLAPLYLNDPVFKYTAKHVLKT